MPQPLFDVFFRGALLPDADPARVRDHLGRLFGLKPVELDRLFGGRPVCVKRGIDVDTAAQLRGRFRDAGALVDIRPAETARTVPPPETPGAAAPAPAATGGSDPWPPAPPQAGSLADHARPVAAAPRPDTSGMTLAPAGVPVSDAAAPPPATIDTSHLTMAEPNTGSLEDCRREKPARPIRDISHLKLSDD